MNIVRETSVQSQIVIKKVKLTPKNSQVFYTTIPVESPVTQRQLDNNTIEIPNCIKQHMIFFKPGKDWTACLQFDFESYMNEEVETEEDNDLNWKFISRFGIWWRNWAKWTSFWYCYCVIICFVVFGKYNRASLFCEGYWGRCDSWRSFWSVRAFCFKDIYLKSNRSKSMNLLSQLLLH